MAFARFDKMRFGNCGHQFEFDLRVLLFTRFSETEMCISFSIINLYVLYNIFSICDEGVTSTHTLTWI